MSTVLQIANLSKQYRLGVIGHGTLYRDIQSRWCRFRGKEDPNLPLYVGTGSNGRPRNIWALKGVSLEAEQGKVLGIIGRNGAGKSTLLKIISRITAPTTGEVRIKGRIASLLEVGTGFHPELTGRENVLLNGAILGMTKAEVGRKFDEIADFSGIGKFIDTPVKRYSSGMSVRLAFAVGAHLEPEILLVDEVLAVGDAEFQKKCLGKMDEVTKQGRTVLFVSHNMDAVSTLCDRVIWIDDGEIFLDGPTQEVVPRYCDAMMSLGAQERDEDKLEDKPFYFRKFYPADEQGNPLQSVRSGEDLAFCFEYRCKPEVRSANLWFNMAFGQARISHLFSCPYELTKEELASLPLEGCFICKIPAFPLVPGIYEIMYGVRVNEFSVDKVRGLIRVDEAEGNFEENFNFSRARGIFVPRFQWEAKHK